MNGDKKGVQPLDSWQKTLAPFASIGGLIVLLLAMGVQNAISTDPELLKGWGNIDDLGKMAGAVITFLGIWLHKSNEKTQEAAIDKISKEAPVDDDGKQSEHITAAAAIEQAIRNKNFPFARRMMDAIHPEEPPAQEHGLGDEFPAAAPDKRSVA